MRRLSILSLALLLAATNSVAALAASWQSNPADQGVSVAITGSSTAWTVSPTVVEGDALYIGATGGVNLGTTYSYYYAVGVGSTPSGDVRFSQAPGATTFGPSAAADNPLTVTKMPNWFVAGNWDAAVPNGTDAQADLVTNAGTPAIFIDQNLTLGTIAVDTTAGGLNLLATSRNATPVSTLTLATSTGTPTITVTGGESFSLSESKVTGTTPGNASGRLLIAGSQGLVIDNQNPVLAPVQNTGTAAYAVGGVRFGFGLDWSRFSGDLTLTQGVFQPLAGGSLNNNLSALPLDSRVVLGTGTNTARLEIASSASRPVIRGLDSTSPNSSVIVTGGGAESFEIGSYGQVGDVFTYAGNIGAVTAVPTSTAVRLTKSGAGTQYLTGTNEINAIAANTISIGLAGGKLSLGTTGSLGTATAGQGTMNADSHFAAKNGEFEISGVGLAAPRSQTFQGSLLFGNFLPQFSSPDTNMARRSNGESVFTVIADPSQPTTLTYGSVRNRNFTVASADSNLNGATMLYRGTNLGSTPGNGVGSIIFTTAPTVGVTGYLNTVSGTGTVGTPQAPVFKGALADTSATGTGAGFATYDATNGVRLLDSATEQTAVATGAAYDAAATSDNILLNLAANEAITGHGSNTLQIANTSGVSRTVTNAGSGLNPANGLLFSGSDAIVLAGGTLTGTAATDAEDVVIHSINTAGVTIQMDVTNPGQTSPVARQGWITYNGPGDVRIEGTQTVGSGGGLALNGTGTTTLAGTIVDATFLGVNQGAVRLDTGATWTNTPRLQLAAGTSFDLNGITGTTTENRFSDIAPDWQTGAAAAGYMPSGGELTNSSATTVDLVLSGTGGANNQPFFGTITGNLNLVVDKGTSIQSLANANTYTGTTSILSGTINIARGGSLPSATVVTLGDAATATTATLTLGDGNGSTNGPARQEIAGLYSVAAVGGTAQVLNQGANISQLTLNIGTGIDNVYTGNLGQAVSGNGQTQNLFGIRKTGAGTFEIAGAINSYSGGTVVEGGILRISADAKLGQIGSLTGAAGSSGAPVAPISAFENSLVLNGGTLQTTTAAAFVLDAKRGIGLGPATGSTGGTGTLLVDSGVTLSYAGVIASAGNTGTQTLAKDGAGTLLLEGLSTFTGLTQATAGILGGSGSLASSLQIDSTATLAPGSAAIGTFTVDGSSATIAGLLAVELDGTGSGSADLLDVAGLLDLSAGSSTVDFSVLGSLDDAAYVIANYGSISGTFATVTNLPTGYTLNYSYLGNSVALVSVPEPGSVALLAAASIAATILRRRRAA
jgi:fibronectin-binding autotransporter adhesin